MGELVVFGDLVCPWATVIVLRLRAARARAGGEDSLVIRHRALPLELEHSHAIPRRTVDAEIPAVQRHGGVADGTMICNPGTRTSWTGGRLPRGTPTLEADEPAIYDRIVADALGLVAAGSRSLAT